MLALSYGGFCPGSLGLIALGEAAQHGSEQNRLPHGQDSGREKAEPRFHVLLQGHTPSDPETSPWAPAVSFRCLPVAWQWEPSFHYMDL